MNTILNFIFTHLDLMEGLLIIFLFVALIGSLTGEGICRVIDRSGDNG